MAWNSRFRIGDGNIVAIDEAPSVYRGYAEDCGITMTEEIFEEQSELFTIYQETNLLSDVVFTPETVVTQDLSDYYFCRLEMKIPRVEE